MSDKNTLSASEAIYGFAAWITTRDKEVSAGASHNCAVWAELVGEFCEANGLDSPRDTYTDNLKFPQEKQNAK